MTVTSWRLSYHSVLAIISDDGAAEEFLQDCFVRAHAAMGRVDGRNPLSNVAEAEKILSVDEAVIAPIYYYTFVVCDKPYVERTYQLVGG